MDTEISDATAAENRPVYDAQISVNEVIEIDNNNAQI